MEVANQLIQDRERYRTHPDCKALVCLVYDPAGLSHNPPALDAAVEDDKRSTLSAADRALIQLYYTPASRDAARQVKATTGASAARLLRAIV